MGRDLAEGVHQRGQLHAIGFHLFGGQVRGDREGRAQLQQAFHGEEIDLAERPPDRGRSQDQPGIEAVKPLELDAAGVADLGPGDDLLALPVVSGFEPIVPGRRDDAGHHHDDGERPAGRPEPLPLGEPAERPVEQADDDPHDRAAEVAVIVDQVRTSPRRAAAVRASRRSICFWRWANRSASSTASRPPPPGRAGRAGSSTRPRCGCETGRLGRAVRLSATARSMARPVVRGRGQSRRASAGRNGDELAEGPAHEVAQSADRAGRPPGMGRSDTRARPAAPGLIRRQRVQRQVDQPEVDEGRRQQPPGLSPGGPRATSCRRIGGWSAVETGSGSGTSARWPPATGCRPLRDPGHQRRRPGSTTPGPGPASPDSRGNLRQTGNPTPSTSSGRPDRRADPIDPPRRFSGVEHRDQPVGRRR